VAFSRAMAGLADRTSRTLYPERIQGESPWHRHGSVSKKLPSPEWAIRIGAALSELDLIAVSTHGDAMGFHIESLWDYKIHSKPNKIHPDGLPHLLTPARLLLDEDLRETEAAAGEVLRIVVANEGDTLFADFCQIDLPSHLRKMFGIDFHP
jgi:hypothetical protein